MKFFGAKNKRDFPLVSQSSTEKLSTRKNAIENQPIQAILDIKTSEIFQRPTFQNSRIHKSALRQKTNYSLMSDLDQTEPLLLTK